MRIHLDDCCGLYRLTGIVLHSKRTIGPAVITAFQKRMFTGETPQAERHQGYIVNNGTRIPFDPAKKPLVVFTDAVQYGRGMALKEYIERNNLGTVTASKPVFNINSNHMIQGFFWEVNYDTLYSWCGEAPKQEEIGSDIGHGDSYRHRHRQKEDNEYAVQEQMVARV